jgi:hypothetical protein
MPLLILEYKKMNSRPRNKRTVGLIGDEAENLKPDATRESRLLASLLALTTDEKKDGPRQPPARALPVKLQWSPNANGNLGGLRLSSLSSVMSDINLLNTKCRGQGGARSFVMGGW